MSIDAVVRIALAMALLFIVVPALAWPRSYGEGALQRFFWNFGVGTALITFAGQLLTLGRLFSFITFILLLLAVMLFCRARHRGVTPWVMLKQTSESAFLAILNVFDGRVNLARRLRRRYRKFFRLVDGATNSRADKMRIAGWLLLAIVAAAFRLYRPFASANLGFSDTYVHLYLVKLLEEGQQVDPEWGPYPRGMHFLLRAIYLLTNVDEILLMNFFGAMIGVLITLGIAETARRMTKSVAAGLVAGVLFATMIGGPSQYFVLGAAFATDDVSEARTYLETPYADFPANEEFDITLTNFHRQTSTLSQETAVAFLFPALLFLFDYLRRRTRWHLVGFAGCTASIAATHSGVLVPLIVTSALIVVALAIERTLHFRPLRSAVIAGAGAVIAGSSWALAFIAYPYSGGRGPSRAAGFIDSPALYYFPFLRRFARDDVAIAEVPMRVFVDFTPALMAGLLLSLVLIAVAFRYRDEGRGNYVWGGLVFLTFLLFHFASMAGLPQLLETRRNSQWLLMALCLVMGMGVAAIGSLQSDRRFRFATATVVLLLLAGWASRVPVPSSRAIHGRVVNYSGYGGSALAVLRIERSLEPYTWTLVSYGQEFPMVLRRGFHLSADYFLQQYDPAEAVTPIPTRHVFVIVEKKPHSFQINSWSDRFSRTELEERLQTWLHLYQATHRNVRVFVEDENVRVYHIERTTEEVERAMRPR